MNHAKIHLEVGWLRRRSGPELLEGLSVVRMHAPEETLSGGRRIHSPPQQLTRPFAAEHRTVRQVPLPAPHPPAFQRQPQPLLAFTQGLPGPLEFRRLAQREDQAGHFAGGIFDRRQAPIPIGDSAFGLIGEDKGLVLVEDPFAAVADPPEDRLVLRVGV